MILWCDCDGTLIHWWDASAEASVGAPYRVDYSVVNAVNRFLASVPAAELVVWSGGGQSYAASWAQKLFPHCKLAVAKDVRLPAQGDLCVDDMPLKVDAPVLLPQDFVKRLDTLIAEYRA